MNFATILKQLLIQTQFGLCEASLAAPQAEGRYPGVLFLMDAFGPRPYLTKMIQRLAANGYVVLLPNLFYRQKQTPIIDLDFPLRPEDMPEARRQFMPFIQNYDIESGLKDIGVFLEFLKQQKNVHGKAAITGYCMGGAMAIRAAAKYPESIYAVASFHAGHLATEKPDSPHLLLHNIQAKLYVAHADQDESMPLDQIERFQQAVDQTTIRHQVEIYKNAAHGFTMEDLPAYNPEALTHHWKHLLKILSDD